jgi:hypothetical protein
MKIKIADVSDELLFWAGKLAFRTPLRSLKLFTGACVVRLATLGDNFTVGETSDWSDSEIQRAKVGREMFALYEKGMDMLLEKRQKISWALAPFSREISRLKQETEKRLSAYLLS